MRHTGHDKINRNVNKLSFQMPERFAVYALSWGNAAISGLRGSASLLSGQLPELASDCREMASMFEEGVRYFGGIVRDYARLRKAKGLPPLISAASRDDADA